MAKSHAFLFKILPQNAILGKCGASTNIFLQGIGQEY